MRKRGKGGRERPQPFRVGRIQRTDSPGVVALATRAGKQSAPRDQTDGGRRGTRPRGLSRPDGIAIDVKQDREHRRHGYEPSRHAASTYELSVRDRELDLVVAGGKVVAPERETAESRRICGHEHDLGSRRDFDLDTPHASTLPDRMDDIAAATLSGFPAL
jgi:hypothetical protein